MIATVSSSGRVLMALWLYGERKMPEAAAPCASAAPSIDWWELVSTSGGGGCGGGGSEARASVDCTKPCSSSPSRRAPGWVASVAIGSATACWVANKDLGRTESRRSVSGSLHTRARFGACVVDLCSGVSGVACEVRVPAASAHECCPSPRMEGLPPSCPKQPLQSRALATAACAACPV